MSHQPTEAIRASENFWRNFKSRKVSFLLKFFNGNWNVEIHDIDTSEEVIPALWDGEVARNAQIRLRDGNFLEVFSKVVRFPSAFIFTMVVERRCSWWMTLKQWMIGRTGNDGPFVWSLLWIPETSFEEWQPSPSIPHAMITPSEGGAADWQEPWNKIIFKRNSNVYVFDTFER